MNEEKNIQPESSKPQASSDNQKKLTEESHSPKPASSNQQPASAEASADKPATENMETHAHHLHKAPGKKIWHYFFEFLMLFFAVFLGFLAENQREHYAERHKAKEFAKSLIKDLKRDTTNLITCKLRTKTITDAIDSLKEILRSKNINGLKGNHLYYYGRQLTNNMPFIPFDATIKQLVSSGSLRYFQNSSIVDKITEYDRLIRYVVYDQGDNIKAQHISELQARFFDIDEIELIKIKTTDWSFENDSILHIEAGLLTYDALQLQQLKQFARLRSAEFKRFLVSIDTTVKQARELITELKKEYHLE